MFEWMSVETLKYYTNEVKKAIEKILAKVAKTGDFNDLINKPNKVIDITQEDYDALPTSDKMNPEIYYNILNAPGGGGTPSSGWDSLDGKPFETLGDGFYVEQYELNLETRLVDITQEDYDNLNTDDLFDPHVFWNIKNPREEAVDYSKWGNIQEKPFEAIGEGLEVDNDELFVSKRLIDITQEDYDSLTTELQMDPHIFWHITDAYGGGGVYDILMTKEELEANTEPGKLVDALVIKGMGDSLNGIDLRVNPETGKPEWKERGADTYSPFSGEPKIVSATLSGRNDSSWGCSITVYASDYGLSKIYDIAYRYGIQNTSVSVSISSDGTSATIRLNTGANSGAVNITCNIIGAE